MIETIDQLIGGFQPGRFFNKSVSPGLVIGRPHCYWGTTGIPGPGGYDATLNGVNLVSAPAAQVPGQIPFYDPGGSATEYLARLVAAATIGGILLLCDRLWHNGGLTITSTSAQTLTQPVLPPRDNNGRSNGDGVLIGLEVSAVSGAASPALTLGYTNSAGVAGRSGVNAFATSGSQAGSFYQFTQQAGDLGVQSVQSLQLSASWLSGTINLVAYRVLATLELTAPYTGTALDALTAGLPILYPGTVPFLVFIPSAATATTVTGQMFTAIG